MFIDAALCNNDLTVWNKRDQLITEIHVHLKGLKVTVVDTDDICTRKDRFSQVRFVMHLNQCLHT